jgi:TolA-binding protein
VKQYAVGRLVDAANKSNRFDAAVTAYVTMLQLDPVAASRIRPTIPAGSSYVDTAISQVNEALGAQLTDEQKIALLQFQVDLYNSKKDSHGSEQAAAQLDELLAKDPNNPNAARANARRKLQLANQALDAKKYQDALTAINSSAAIFTDPQQQADALYLIAQAREGLAGSGTDRNALKDAALCYMRVVADFKDLPGKPHVADSLLKTADIEAQLNDTDAAAKLYQQIADQFPGDPAAATAKQKLANIKPKT